MTTVRKPRKKKKVKGLEDVLTREEFESQALETRITLIQQLIPIGLMAVAEELQREVAELVGAKYQPESESHIKRYGSNPGTVLLGGQKVPIRVPRLRSKEGEVPLKSYDLLHNGINVNEKVLNTLLGGLSCSKHETTLDLQAGSIGSSKSTISRRFVKASQEKLDKILKRDLGNKDIIAVFIDGKYFAEDQMVIALGIDINGDKVLLGFVQTDTENKVVIADFLRGLINRGLKIDAGLLVIIDGATGLRAAIRSVFGKKALVQRCQWHKRENVVSYLTKSSQKEYRAKLQRAYERPTYDEAKEDLMNINMELHDINQSAANSLEEGLEETLTLHMLDVFQVIGKSFKTTNCIESVNASIENICKRIDYWKNSSQKQRWMASAICEIEPKLRRIKGCSHLLSLRKAIQEKLVIDVAKDKP